MAMAQKSRESKKVVVINKENRKKVITVRTLPGRTVIKYKGFHYYYANNKFYTYSGGRYIAIAPKKGFRIKNPADRLY